MSTDLIHPEQFQPAFSSFDNTIPESTALQGSAEPGSNTASGTGIGLPSQWSQTKTNNTEQNAKNFAQSEKIPLPQPNAGGPSTSNVQQRRIIAEDPEWNLAPVDKLTDICLRVIVLNFEKAPILKALPPKYRPIVISQISTQISLQIAAPLIPDDDYWKRRAKEKYALASIRDHGNSWKRLFFELYLQEQIEQFRPTSDSIIIDPALKKLYEELSLGSPFVEKLHLRQVKPIILVNKDDENDTIQKSENGKSNSAMDHFDVGSILFLLKNLKDFGVYYGVKDCGIDFSWAYFGMTLKDATTLAKGLSSFSPILQKLTIQASSIDDDKCRLICHALLGTKSVTYLDLSHNKIGDNGARGLAKLLATLSNQLVTLKLSNNQISQDGARYIGKALQISKTLEHLDMRLNHLQDLGGQALLVCIFKNKSLVSIDLSGNGLESKTVQALAALLKFNLITLNHLDFSCNKLGDYTGEKSSNGSDTNLIGVPKVADAAGKILFEAISQNKYVINFDLRTTGISPEYLVAIQGIVNENAEPQ